VRRSLTIRISKYLFSATALLMAVLIFTPTAARASVAEILALFQAITSTLRNVGGVLSQVQTAEAQIAATRQQLVWPLTQINQAKALTVQMRTQYVPAFQNFKQLQVNSATLPLSGAFESMLRSGSVADVTQVSSAFGNLYQRVPMVSDAAPADRALVDMSDALSQDSLKQTIAGDQVARMNFDLANALEQRTSTTAPGTAVYITVEAQLATLEEQAQSLKLLAAQLRTEAGQLAHENALLKKRAVNAQHIHQQLEGLFVAGH